MNNSARTQPEPIKYFPLWLVAILVCVLFGIAIWLATSQANKPVVDDFDSCKKAGGAIAESYPEQCYLDGKSYVNKAQLSNGSQYIGLSEQAALDKAAREGVAHRVVERDDESLPVTMDYVVGRHNFHVRDGHVYKVDIEGHEQ